ncbi:hypothetical protein VTO42DRAFT_62 [Malbranchea cinnamomea]
MEWLPRLKYLVLWLSFIYGLCVFLLYGLIAVCNGAWFHRSTEKANLELLLAKDRFWNLSRKWAGFTHYFLTLRTGYSVHYVANRSPEQYASTPANNPLVIFVHGFPDSWAIWRHLLASSTLQQCSTMIALDLPGYGGSDSLDQHGATEVLEALTEFIATIRERYGVDKDGFQEPARRVIIVGHDWGGLLSFRLAAEAPQLADRFIITNGPLPWLVRSNIKLTIDSATKMIRTFMRDPLRSWSILLKSACTLKPVLRQLRLSGYIFVFQLPIPLVRYLGTGADFFFLKTIHRLAAGETGEYTLRDAQESMASTLGPGESECRTETENGERYSSRVCSRQKKGNFGDLTSYYRHNAALGSWHKSLETISALHAIHPNEPRRTSSGTGIFDHFPGTLKANTTVVWGLKDCALDSYLMLEGIVDYLVYGSQVISLPKTGHFTPMEVESRIALEETLKWAIGGEKTSLEAVVAAVYPRATVAARK